MHLREARERFISAGVPDIHVGPIHGVYVDRAPRPGTAFTNTRRADRGFEPWRALCGTVVKIVRSTEFADVENPDLCEACIERLRIITANGWKPELVVISRWG